MRKYKIFYLIMAVMLTFVLTVTACGGGSDTNKAPTISNNQTSTFDKNEIADIVITVDLYGSDITSIEQGQTKLTNSDYSLSGKSLTIKSSYLASLEENAYNFKLSTKNGSATFKIVVTNTADDQGFVRPDYNAEYYDNLDFNEYVKGEDVTIEGQWEGYGIGDPFILRHNGMYYLYVSSLNATVGVKAWQSTDLISWAQVQTEGLEKGYVSDDPITRGAYAPEVYYFNGKFYMYTSPGGNGHYILTSDSPTGPFVAVTDNIGLSIDGSVFIDDDESMYFTHANNSGIRIRKMDDMLSISSSSMVLDNTSIGSWTEGSFMMKKDGNYFLTYTGNHVVSNGYRISYAVANELGNRDAFSKGAELPVVLDTEDNFKGLGHSASFMGPDMDSHYMTYHSLNNAGGPNRSLNIDRILFNGTQMSVSAGATGSVKASLPRFYSYDTNNDKFTTSGQFTLSNEVSNGAFTAEFNTKGGDNVHYVVGYTDDQNYTYAKTSFENHKIELIQKVSGADKVIATGELVNDFDTAVNHTVRLAYNNGKCDVYFDDLKKIEGASLTIANGEIGYYGDTSSVELGYTALSDVSMGDSDALEFKQSDVAIGSSTYMPNGSYQNDKALVLGDGSGVSTIEYDDAYTFKGAKELKLANTGDLATYLVNFKETGFYGIELIYDKQYGGKSIAISTDNSDHMIVTLPTVETEERFVKTIVTEFNVESGVNQVVIENVGDAFAFVSFDFVKTSTVTPLYSQSLEEYATTGVDYQTIWKLSNGGHLAQAGTRQLVYFGDQTITDFTLEVDMMLVGSTSSSTAGIIFHADNYASSSHDDYRSMQGYYLSFTNNNIKIERLNYSYTQTLDGGVKVTQTASDEFFTVKIVARKNTFTVSVNGELLFEVNDSLGFNTGKLGLYTNGASCVYKNLSITA